jgi:hypothetical protein
MKNPVNKTPLRKGGELYYILPWFMLAKTGDYIIATIERVTTTSEYILCHTSYIDKIFSGERKEKGVALFPNRPDIPKKDITEYYYTDKSEAMEAVIDTLRRRDYIGIGANLCGIVQTLKDNKKLLL